MKKSKLIRLITLAVMLISSLTALLGGARVLAVDTANTQNIRIHKLQFKTMPDNTQNTGAEMTWTGSEPLAGAVFTAYDATTDYWTAYDAAPGNTEAKKAAGIAAAKLASQTNGIAFPATGSDGIANGALPMTSGGRKAVYLFVETTSPAGVNQEKSVPFVLGLPIYDEGGNLRNPVHVYPKNEVKEVSLGFTKYGIEVDGTKATLAKAQFILKDVASGLYYNSSNNKFDITDVASASKIESNDNGIVSVSGLILNPGKYEFYEVDSTVSTSQGQSTANNEIFHYKNNPVVTATVATNMEVTYDYYNRQLVKQTGAESAEAYNYKVPVPKKEADDTDVDAGQIVKFTITQKIPDDVAQYTEYKLVDNYDARLSLVSTDAQILSSLKIGGSTATDVIPTYSAGANQFTLTFTPSQLAKYAGETMTFEVEMTVTPGTDLTTIENKITFDNNFYDKHDTEKIKTFGKRFVKEDANTKEKLAGAEFKITNGSGKYLQYIDASNNPIATVTGDKMDSAVAVQWVDSKEMGTTLVSGTDGKFSVFGIASGSYTLIETKAPDGYVTMPDLTFVADDGTQTLSVINKSKGILPSTGGMGIIGLVLLGVITITGAAIYFKKRAGYTEV